MLLEKLPQTTIEEEKALALMRQAIFQASPKPKGERKGERKE